MFQRLALSKDKDGVLALAEKGQEITKPQDTIKDPYIFEFLELPKESIVKERDLETRLINNLQEFLLELGKGFSFLARQFKITVDNEHFFIDLVFYHRILKCFVLIDLKTKKIKHQDIGQMNLYLNYYKLKNLFGRDIDLVEEQTLKNTILIKSINRSKELVYG
nr:PDDEXK nuclease domain-containing protein [Pedobacter insulae]